jgi:deoxyribonuclease IV
LNQFKMDSISLSDLLTHLTTTDKTALKKLLPKGITMPEADAVRISPHLIELLSHETILQDIFALDTKEPSVEIVTERIQNQFPEDSEVPYQVAALLSKGGAKDKILGVLKAAKEKMAAVVLKPLRFNVESKHQSICLRMDALNDTQLFHIRLSSALKKDWVSLLFELFAHAAFDVGLRIVYLVLPLQDTIWKMSLDGWMGRKGFREFLLAKSKQVLENIQRDKVVGSLLREKYFIGFHVSKQKCLMDTIAALPDSKKPYQIFLGAPQSTGLRIEDGELAAAGALVAERGVSVYVHSPYIINLCVGGNTWNTALLKKNLQYAAKVGCKGVVVHVGKSTDKPLAEAMETMKANLLECLEAATPSCPLLLETPAGQGTETLKGDSEFVDFVAGIGDERLGVCLDTCHVFACGHKPLEYISRFDAQPGLLKLIHYNDSATPCGSCVDRHAFMGTGHIGMDGMKAIAEMCGSRGLPMLIE